MLSAKVLNNVSFDILNSKWAEPQINTHRRYVAESRTRVQINCVYLKN